LASNPGGPVLCLRLEKKIEKKEKRFNVNAHKKQLNQPGHDAHNNQHIAYLGFADRPVLFHR
jgi:hypothetical protein